MDVHGDDFIVAGSEEDQGWVTLRLDEMLELDQKAIGLRHRSNRVEQMRNLQ